jgi:hydrogenase maturation protease
MSTGKTLVVGLGNPILGDDGVGWRVAEEVERRLPKSRQTSEVSTPVEVDCVSLGGLSLMERLVGYDRAILVDAIATGQQPVGSVACLALEDLPDRSAGHTTAAHDASLPTALQMGRVMGAHLPEQVAIVAVEAQAVYDFSEELSAPVAAAIPAAVAAVMKLLHLE